MSPCLLITLPLRIYLFSSLTETVSKNLESLKHRVSNKDILTNTVLKLKLITIENSLETTFQFPQEIKLNNFCVCQQVIYVARNPKDAVVSYYHHHRLWNGYVGTFEDFFDAFLADVREYLQSPSYIKCFLSARFSCLETN
jgi:hypothetical protein